MRGRLLIIILFVGFMSCSEEDLPAGLYDYQVERLLSGQDGSKTWLKVINSENCADSIRLMFELVANTADDSLDVSRIIGCSGSEDTTYLGRADASRFPERDLFTDSLIFANDDFWIVNQITSQILWVEVDDSPTPYRCFN